MRPSPLNAFLRLNEWVWPRLPRRVTDLPPVALYSRVLHRVILATAVRRQYFGTFFFRNRRQLALVRQLVDRYPIGARVRLAFLACSNGAELYSVLWTLRSARPDLQLVVHGADISAEVLALAQNGVYSLAAPELVDEAIFSRMTREELAAMFDLDVERGTARIKPWIADGIAWHRLDARSPDVVDRLGAHDLVFANNFLCHMPPPEAERCLRNVARLVAPGGYLVVSGVDLDVRARVASELGWHPVRDLLRDIHEDDPTLRRDWPLAYWSLEPFDSRRLDADVRYASVFTLGATTARLPEPVGQA